MTLYALKGTREWLLRTAGHNIVLGPRELDELSQELAFRLKFKGIVATGSGVGLAVGDDTTMHLCHTDEIPGVVAAIRALEFGGEYA